MASSLDGFLARFDDYQQHHPWLGFPFAVLRKFLDDQAGNLAALMAYYAFFSIFPLLLALTTILGYVLAGNPVLEHKLFSTALGQFPIIGQQNATRPLTGNPAGLVIGLALAIWSGLGVAGMAQQAFKARWVQHRPPRSADQGCAEGRGECGRIADAERWVAPGGNLRGRDLSETS